MFQAIVKSQIGEDISILVRKDNHPWNYLCECGDASLLTVKEIQNCKAVFISHTHIDHFVNFDAVIRHQIGTQRRVVICGPKGIAEQVQARIKSYTWNLIEKGSILYEIREMVNEKEILIYELEPPIWELTFVKKVTSSVLFTAKSFQVSATLLDHKTPVMAYLFKEEDTLKMDIQSSGFKGGKWVKQLKEAFMENNSDLEISIEDKSFKASSLFHLLHLQKGDTLGIIMDHAANTANHHKIEAHFKGARKVLIESFYKADDKEQADLNYHSYSSQSGAIMHKTKVQEAVPVHFSRKYTEEDILIIRAEFEKAWKASR